MNQTARSENTGFLRKYLYRLGDRYTWENAKKNDSNSWLRCNRFLMVSWSSSLAFSNDWRCACEPISWISLKFWKGRKSPERMHYGVYVIMHMYLFMSGICRSQTPNEKLWHHKGPEITTWPTHRSDRITQVPKPLQADDPKTLVFSKSMLLGHCLASFNFAWTKYEYVFFHERVNCLTASCTSLVLTNLRAMCSVLQKLADFAADRLYTFVVCLLVVKR